MKNKRLLNIIGEIDERHIKEAAPQEKKTQRPAWMKWGAMAASMLLILLIGVPYVFNNDGAETEGAIHDVGWQEEGSDDVVFEGEPSTSDTSLQEQSALEEGTAKPESAVVENSDGGSGNLSDIDDEGFPNWGLKLSVENVTESGLTLVCTQSGGKPTGELQTGSDYKLVVLKEGWEEVPVIIEDYGWNEEAYMIAKENATELEIEWEWLYGKLPAGTYRLMKVFTNFRQSGDYDAFSYWAEFEIK